MLEYHDNKTYCPNCGHTVYTTPLIAVRKQGIDYPLAYIGSDECTCTDCEDVHNIKDRLLKCEKRTFKIDVGNVPIETIEQYIQNIQEKIKTDNFLLPTGSYDIVIDGVDLLSSILSNELDKEDYCSPFRKNKIDDEDIKFMSNPAYGIDVEAELMNILNKEIWDGFQKDLVEARYAKKPVNPNYYGIVNVTGVTDKSEIPTGSVTYIGDITDDVKTKYKSHTTMEPGVVWAPYIPVYSTDGPSKEYKEFMKKYKEDHQCCPKCGSTSHRTTLMGYIFNSEKPEEYKDENRCVCGNCGDVHIYHDRISVNAFKNHAIYTWEYLKKELEEIAKKYDGYK